jgi:hypothetical protein
MVMLLLLLSMVHRSPPLSLRGEWWLSVDLGAGTPTVYGVGVAWGDAHPALYTIETSSDGSAWTAAYNETGGASYTAGQQPELTSDLPVPPSARWLRIRASVSTSLSSTVNLVETGVASAGGWGGTCTCPDGQVY